MKISSQFATNILAWSVCSFLFTGCGGGGGSDDDSGGGAPGGGTVSAPASMQGRAFDFTTGEAQQELRFATSGNTFTQFDTASGTFTRSGTYTYVPSGNTASITLTDSVTNEAITFQLVFASSTEGTFNFTSNTGGSGAGTFSNLRVAEPGGGPSPGPDPDPGEDPDPGPGPGGGLDGRVMSLTRTTGQTHFYTFTASRFLDEDGNEKGAGTYVYSRSGSQANLTLNYTETVSGPVELAGDRHEIQLIFTGEETGTYTSTYFFNEGGSVPQDGSFRFVE